MEQRKPYTEVHNHFSAISGAIINMEGMLRREVFELLFNDELVQIIILKTNKYGATNRNFIKITEDELKVYIALNILISIIQKFTEQNYWSIDIGV